VTQDDATQEEVAQEEAEVREAPSEDALPAAAIVDQRGAEPPRRGWWSRFVRKDE
jgi:hypothetical protein